MDKNQKFVHLHVHTEYSMLDGLNRIPSLVAKVKELGMPAVAITDHGVLYGMYEFHKTCKENEIKPIIGCEVYVAPTERTFRKAVDGIKYYHLLLLAKNQIGYHNLVKLSSFGHLEGFYYKPRIDRDLLEKYSEGIICTSACPQGPLGKHIMRNEHDRALEWMKFLRENYKDDFYLELQRHYTNVDAKSNKDKQAPIYSQVKEPATDEEDEARYFDFESVINDQLIKWGKEFSIPLIATTDAHYLNAEDEETQDILFAVKDGKRLDDTARRRAYKNTYIKSTKEMEEIFSDVPEVIKNTQDLADKVELYDIGYKRVQPIFPDTPKGKTSQEYLKDIAYLGAKAKYHKISQEVTERIEMELELIHDKGYDDYFLVFWDIVRFAKANKIIVGARGSVGGSVVAYCLDIVYLEPISNELYFERFLNPERRSPPDIDLDIQDSRRKEVLQYVEEKYGHDSVCGIITFGKFQTRQAIKDICRVMGLDLSIANNLSKMVEVTFGKPKSIKYMMEKSLEFKSIIESDERLKIMADTVSKIDGQRRHVSVHACGHLITSEPLVDYVPVQHESGSDKVITQLEFPELESMGLMKFDFLALANLSVLDYALKLIKDRTGEEIDLYKIPDGDKKAYKIFQDGNTTGIFQFEGAGMKRYLKELKPENLGDLCFMGAAYRPGPMQFIQGYIDCKNKKRKVEYLIPQLEPILKSTYGFLIYQEQVLRIAVDIAGYSMGSADMLRRAMGKKKMEVMLKESEKFIEGCIKQGHTKEIGQKLFAYVQEFANYGFPKSHAANYGLIAYWEAYLKARYPIEFMSARLSTVMEFSDKLTIALDEARNMGIKLLPPSVNKSHGQFAPEGKGSIRFGLNGVKNVGRNVVEELINERSANGQFLSLYDFIQRIPSVNSRMLEALIKVGAMDEFGKRSAQLQIQQTLLSEKNKKTKNAAPGQLDMFSDSPVKATTIKVTLPDIEEVSISDKLAWEKELLGIYFTSHPINDYASDPQNLVKILQTESVEEGKEITAAALISKMKRITTKSGDPMAFLTLEGHGTPIEGVIFPRDYAKYKEKLIQGKVIAFSARANKRNGEMSIVISKIINAKTSGSDSSSNHGTPPSGGGTNSNGAKYLKSARLILSKNVNSNDISNLRDILIENPGNVKVTIIFNGPSGEKTFNMKVLVDENVITTIISNLSMIEKIVYD